MLARWYIARISENVGTLVLLFSPQNAVLRGGKERRVDLEWRCLILFALWRGFATHGEKMLWVSLKKLKKLSNLRPRTHSVWARNREVIPLFGAGIDGFFLPFSTLA